MKYFFTLLIFASSSLLIIQAQIRGPQTYALIIGVSKYADPKITSLKHANKDAEAFGEFCASPSGLNVAEDRLRVLIDEKASYWNIIDGLDWLKNTAIEGDQIYIYFAGHGDMESADLKYGYLLAHDSRYLNYLGRSLSLDLLNKTAHTLTVNKKAKVFLITDACHSGKLAGVDFDASSLVALKLMKLVDKNEVRITSCNEGEKSYEDVKWGGGRGAFSYFLKKGMQGEADGSKDGVVSIGEIKSYLSANVPKQVVMVKQSKQNPVIMGLEESVLNSYKPTTNDSEALPSSVSADNVLTSGARSVGSVSKWDEFENDLKYNFESLSNSIDFSTLSKQPQQIVVNELLGTLREQGKYDEKLLSSPEASKIIAKALYEKVQQIIDLYLSGDEEELEKRRYYSQIDKPYIQYPYMLDIAIKLLPSNHELIPSLQLQRAYMAGLNYRLQAAFKENSKAYIDTALTYQKIALSLDTTSAYVFNELGILSADKAKIDIAIRYYKKAIQISPLWPLPYGNLAVAYIKKGDLVQAKKYLDIAKENRKSHHNLNIIEGNIYMLADNCLFAEEQYQQSIKINDKHYLPFDKLGLLYTKIQQYEKAETYFLEGAKRKIGLTDPIQVPDLRDTDLDGVIDAFDIEDEHPLRNGDDVISYFLNGMIEFEKPNFTMAKQWFEKVIMLDVTNPMVYHYLGQIAFKDKNLTKATFYFDLASQYHKNDSLLLEEVKIVSGINYDPSTLKEYQRYNFNVYDPNIFLARIYELGGYFNNAIEQYRKCINIEPNNSIAWQMLWNLYKNRMELESAEGVINEFIHIYPEKKESVLADFYKWALATYSEDLQKTEYYSYKYGLLMHAFIKKNPDKYQFRFDSKHKTSSFDIDVQNEDAGMPIISADIMIGSSDAYYELGLIIVEPAEINDPLGKGLEMFKRVESISVDKHVKADALSKIGDFYLFDNDHLKALESYEHSLNIVDDHHYVRMMASKCADFLYLYQKSYGHLTTLEKLNRLNYKDAVVLARYYMEKGEKEKAIKLSDDLSQVHPYLKDEIEMDVIRLNLRFGEYQKAVALINQYTKVDSTDMIIEYMLARSYAGLKKPKDAYKHLKNAEKKGFNLGFVYRYDPIFDPYRSLNSEWQTFQEKMEKYITSKM